MRMRWMALAATAVFLGGCAASDVTTYAVPEGMIGDIPEAVAALAAPGQDLSTARLRPEDGCYWYIYSGPVETTLLPLRTIDGSVICSGAYRSA